VSHHKGHFEKTDQVAFSLLIDASKVAQVVQPNLRDGHVVGGAAPNHHICIPDGDKESRDQLKAIFEDKTKKEASEIKLATALYQWTKDGISPFVQVSARPQMCNETSNFKKHVAEAMVKAENVLHKDDYQVSFACCTNNGVCAIPSLCMRH
jgi:hypothetical protein